MNFLNFIGVEYVGFLGVFGVTDFSPLWFTGVIDPGVSGKAAI